MTDFSGFDLSLVDVVRLLAVLAAGYGAGLVHFATLETVARRIAGGRLSAVALQIGRLAALGLFLFLLVKLGAIELLLGSAGIMLARSRVLARVRAEP
ncbi:MAG: hypothetical protein H6887_06215 [Hoeflea sp.]|nr:hypothetical protein [Rhodobiaceae bacterium]MCC0034855.1 hypothetical protein [Hoeflea sp.]